MREILYRGKRTDTNEWVYGFYWNRGELAHYIKVIDENGNLVGDYEVVKETVCEYIGLTDIDGKRVFENDIVEYDHFLGHFRGCVVEFNKGITYLNSMGSPQYKPYDVKNIQVIGNVFDNKELDGRCRYIR